MTQTDLILRRPDLSARKYSDLLSAPNRTGISEIDGDQLWLRTVHACQPKAALEVKES